MTRQAKFHRFSSEAKKRSAAIGEKERDQCPQSLVVPGHMSGRRKSRWRGESSGEENCLGIALASGKESCPPALPQPPPSLPDRFVHTAADLPSPRRASCTTGQCARASLWPPTSSLMSPFSSLLQVQGPEGWRGRRARLLPRASQCQGTGQTPLLCKRAYGQFPVLPKRLVQGARRNTCRAPPSWPWTVGTLKIPISADDPIPSTACMPVVFMRKGRAAFISWRMMLARRAYIARVELRSGIRFV